jgi:hypothetical protein
MFLGSFGAVTALALSVGMRGGMALQAPEAAVTPIAGMNTLFGPTGLILTPTAQVAPKGNFNFGTSFGEKMRGPSVNWGITQGIEIGGSFIDRDDASDKAVANAKIMIVPQNFRYFTVGIGVIDAADAVNRSWYIVGSADFAVPRRIEEKAVGLRLHAGAGTGIFEKHMFGGAELLLNSKFSLVGEFDGINTNGALRYRHNDAFAIQLGFQHTVMFLGATYGLRF